MGQMNDALESMARKEVDFFLQRSFLMTWHDIPHLSFTRKDGLD